MVKSSTLPQLGEGAVVAIRQYCVRMRMGSGHKPLQKPKIHIFARFYGGNRFTFPTLQLFLSLPTPPLPESGRGN